MRGRNAKTTLFAEILIVAILTLVNGLLSMSELAVVSSRRTKLQTRAERGDKGAAAALPGQADHLPGFDAGGNADLELAAVHLDALRDQRQHGVNDPEHGQEQQGRGGIDQTGECGRNDEPPQGLHMRQRLALLHDVQGRFQSALVDDVFQVRLEIPV